MFAGLSGIYTCFPWLLIVPHAIAILCDETAPMDVNAA
jgi:hypothetical protein